jgi:arylsulfatase A-like enzyme
MAASPRRAPNVLFILTDDQRFDTIAALGNRQIRTPNIDRLVHGGTTFTRAHIMGGTCGAVCMPSRAMLMTGRTLFHLHGEGETRGRTIPPEHVTMPELFRSAGYHTHHIGKWHQDRASFNRSFESADRIFGFTRGWYLDYGGHWNVPVHDYDPTGRYPHETGYIVGPDGSSRLPVEPAVGGVHSSRLFCDAAVDFLDRAGGDERPFFLYLSFVAPHDPRQSPEEYEAMYPSSGIELPPNYLPMHPFDNGDLRIRDELLEGWPRRRTAIQDHIADYYGLITYTDSQIGRVLDALDRAGLAQSTIVVFAGDNGLALGQHGLMGKQSVYEHSARVPLIFRGPGVPAGERSEALCYLLDVFPSLADAAGLECPPTVEGISLLPTMRGERDAVRDHLFCGYKNLQRSIRQERYKLIEYFVGQSRTTQLFDTLEDPWELHNLAESPVHRARLGELRGQLAVDQECWDDPLTTARAL